MHDITDADLTLAAALRRICDTPALFQSSGLYDAVKACQESTPPIWDGQERNPDGSPMTRSFVYDRSHPVYNEPFRT